MSRTLEMGQFLGHQTKGGGSQFLRGWRKRNPPTVNVFLHTKAPIVALWQHGLPKIFEKKDERTGAIQRKVFGGQFNCLEDESVLIKQYRRDRDTGERNLPPVICPMCRLLEELRRLYYDGQVGFADDVFRWEGDDARDTQTLTLGGMLNLYDSDRLTDEEKAAMSTAGILMTEAWKENSYAKCNYLFTVVDADDPESGVQIAIETTALGDATKECIHAKIKELGEREGNPLLHPYAIGWEHNPNAKEFNKKYKAYPKSRIPLTDAIQDLIEADPPDINNLIKGGNITKLRADLETHCVLPDPTVIDWDDVFGPAERAGLAEQEEEAEAEAEAPPPPSKSTPKVAPKAAPKAVAKEEPKPAPKVAPKVAKAEPAPAPVAARRRKAEPEPEVESEAEEAEEAEETIPEGWIPCDECGAMMDPNATKCEKCGAEYEVEPDAEEAEPEAAPEPPKATTKAAPKAAAKDAPKAGKKPIPF